MRARSQNQNQARWCSALTCLLLLLLTACSSFSPPGAGGSPASVIFDNSVAVLGVVSRVQPLSAFKRKEYTAKLEAQLRTHQPKLSILPQSDLRRYLQRRDEDAVDKLAVIFHQYRQYGELTGENLSMLRQSQLPVRYLVLARIERNDTRKFQQFNTHPRNSRGELLTDRRGVTLIHQREVAVSAKTYDVVSGRLVWSGHYTSKPENKNEYIEYTGSSFVGSVAISLANSIVTGRSASHFPAAPREINAVVATFKAIGREMLTR